MRIFFIPLALLLLTSLACDPQQGPSPLVKDDPQAALRDAALREDSAAFLSSLPTLIEARAQASAQTEAASLASALKPGESTSLAHAAPLRDLYARRKFEPLWVQQNGSLTKPGKAFLKTLRAAQTQHGIFPAELHLPPIERHLATLSAPPAKLDDLGLTRAHHDAFEGWFASQAAAFDGEDATLDMLAAVTAEGAPLAHLNDLQRALTQDRIARRDAAAQADLLLSDASVRFVKRMKLDNPAWFKARAWAPELSMPEDADRKTRADIESRRARALVIETLSPLFSGAQTFEELQAAVVPPFEQYARLGTALARYEKLRDEGGWKTLPPEVIGLKSGDAGPAVKLLKQRLRDEGFWGEEDSELYGPKLTEAVKHYQHTHQIWEKGHITDETFRSLNVPVERRYWRIRQSLERWRNMRLGADDAFVFVNIPDFHAEVWDKGERAMRFKVVTGSARRERDEKTREMVMPRSTKLFSDQIEYLVFNPYWNVPQGIVQDEILPELEENPNYLEEHNYEWYETSAGNRILRQTPGEHNALGLVKFLFPNKHDIYLHDTNQKGFFRYPIRAFSHGCMRVHQPMELAEFMLKREGKWDEKRGVARWMQGGGETWIKLDEPLPVHIEYVVARVDDEGHVHFLADVYRMDHEPMTRMSAAGRAYDIGARAMSMLRTQEEARL